MSRIEIEDNGKKGRFAIYNDNEFAGEMTFTWVGESRIIIDHTGVEEKYKGEGVGKQLFIKSVEFARKKNLKVIPLCPFAKRMFEKDKSTQGLL